MWAGLGEECEGGNRGFGPLKIIFIRTYRGGLFREIKKHYVGGKLLSIPGGQTFGMEEARTEMRKYCSGNKTRRGGTGGVEEKDFGRKKKR